MGEYENDFAEWPTPDASWMADITIAVPFDVEINHYVAQERLHGIIDNMRDENGSLRHQLTRERNENARLRGEVGELTAIIDRLTAKTEGGE
jgi:hypothetical protein